MGGNRPGAHPRRRGPAARTATAVVTATGDLSHALTSEGADASEDGTGRGTPIIGFAPTALHDEQASDRLMPTLKSGHGSTAAVMGTSSDLTGGAGVTSAVRRLTPLHLECERLQGIPDQWTSTSNGQPQSDTARYRQLGNSVAVPVLEWVFCRVVAVDEAGVQRKAGAA